VCVCFLRTQQCAKFVMPFGSEPLFLGFGVVCLVMPASLPRRWGGCLPGLLTAGWWWVVFVWLLPCALCGCGVALIIYGEFDPGSGRTLAACLTHASRTMKPSLLGGLVANG